MLERSTQHGAHDGLEYLSFRIGEQDFCIDIMAVREIRGWTQATALPHAPDYVCGVVNLRGAVLPIIDLGSKLGLRAAAPTKQHVIIVAEVGPQVMGLLVDAVNDIITVSEQSIQPTPDIASSGNAGYLTGLVTVEGRMLGLLQLANVLPAEQRCAA